MPGFEFWGDEERKEVNDVLETGNARYADGRKKMIRSVSNKNKLKAHARSFALNSLLLPFEFFVKVYTAPKNV